MMAKLEHGNVGQHTASPLDAQTFSWINSHEMNKFPWHLQWLSEKGDSCRIATRCWLKEQSGGVPSHMWCRTSGQREDRIPQNDRELSILLSRQYRTYKDPQQKQQKALPFIVLKELAKRQVTELDIALGQLTIGAAFFTYCSCKHLTVPQKEERCTKLLCLQNSRFFKGGHLTPAPSADLESADSIPITFEMQKNDSKFDTVIHGQTDDPVLCPVLQWAQLVNRILSYPNTKCDTPVCAVWHHGRLDKITSTRIVGALCRKQGSWKRTPWLQAKQDGDALHLLRSSNGNVSCRGTGLYHHAYWQMVKQRISTLHKKASEAVLTAHHETNAHIPVILNNTGNCTKSSFDQGPLAAQPPQQRQDKTKYWRRHVLTGATAVFFPFQLID